MFAQHAQRVDTLYIAVPKATDTVVVRVAAGSVKMTPDPLHAVVRQTGGHGYVLATLGLTATLIVVTAWAQRQMHRLQSKNNDLQGEHAKLQREFNEMEAQHEADRRAADKKREEEHETAVDAKISAVAYALRRQLRSWLDEAPGETKAMVRITDTWAEAVKQLGGREVGEVPGVTEGMIGGTLNWAGHRQHEHFDRAEARVVELVSAAPQGSAAVAASIRRGYVLFYKATGRLNAQVATIGDVNREASVEALVAAYHELEACIEAVGAAVGKELQQAEKALTPEPPASA